MLTPQQALSLRYLDVLWLRNGKGWDRFVVQRVQGDTIYGQRWDYSGDPETPRIGMETVSIADLYLQPEPKA